MAAGGIRYLVRVDGLACPYCAYGIEKKFLGVDSVARIDIDLERGVVIVEGKEGLDLPEELVRRLVKESGFTYRSIRQEPR